MNERTEFSQGSTERFHMPDFSLVREPYRSWLKSRTDILAGDYVHNPLQDVARDPYREGQLIQLYLEQTKQKYLDYYRVLETVLEQPKTDAAQSGKGGISLIGRRSVSPMDPLCRLSVNIPAKDEELNIRATLRTYADQVDNEGKPLDARLYELNVLVNTSQSDSFDRTYGEILRFKRENPNIRVNALQVKFEDHYARVGMARKFLNDLTLLRSQERKAFYQRPHYLQSDDADLIWVDPKQVQTIIDTFDKNPKLDALVGYQEKYLRMTSHVEFVFMSRRYWDLMTAQAAHYLQRGVIDPKKRDFHNSRPLTYGTNTAMTAESYVLIGGYNKDAAVLEDLDIGNRISILRGKQEKGCFVPELSTIGQSRTRSNSSPRRYFWELIKQQGNQYTIENFQQGEVRKVSLQEMIKLIPDRYHRLTEDTKRFFEKELWFMYESTRIMLPDPRLAKLVAKRSLVLMGFKPEDIEVTDTEIHILNTQNFSCAMQEYRDRQAVPIDNNSPSHDK